MTRTIELIFDFVSPNAYLVWQPLRALAARQGAQIKITPAFLGGMHKLTGNAPPFIRDADVKGKNAYASLEMRRFIAKHGLHRFKMNPKFPFNSVNLLRMLVSLDGDDQIRLIEALTPAIWEQGLDVGDAAAVAAVLTAAGFDAQSLAAKTQDAAIKQALMDNTEKAVERGTFGIPTFFIGDEMFFGKERLGQIEEMLAGT
ncbi:MAG: 2-hydroxychromene-2-carboxylate isomerase [Burkholderiaceae bacterium]|jgi:2-hydroxychromene-2-carboxylate isomerase|nr:2-hydroxychromene-2-carboxylate isomerase [Burkholderiaceae bacterium]TXH37962.1 MAG: 2-hydroxychromene-2-carboxylate isomerase [Burkholderiaceae bacterium]